MSRLAKNTTYLTVASIGQKIVAFVYFALIARIVGVEWTGTYFLALSVVVMIGVLADFGLTPVLVREIAKNPERKQSLLSSVLGIKVVFSIIAAIVVVIVANAFGYDETTRLLMYVAIAVMILDTIHLTLYGAFRGLHILKYESIGIFVGMVITMLVGVASLLIEPNLTILIVALICGSTWNVLYVGNRLVSRGIRPWKLSWSSSTTKKLLGIALPFALAAIFVKIYSTVDTMLLAHYIDEAAVGLYSIAYKLTYAFQFLPLAFVAALYPAFSSLISKKDSRGLMKTFEQSMWYMLIIAVPVVLGLFSTADLVVPLVYGSDFIGSILPLQALVFVLLFIFADYPLGSLLNADDRQVTKTVIVGLTMVVNIIANLVLIPMYGVLGASIAALISFAFLFVVSFIAIQKTLKYTVWSFLKLSAPIVAAGLVMTVVVLFTKDVINIVAIPLGALVYLACLFLFKALTLDQLRLIKGSLKK